MTSSVQQGFTRDIPRKIFFAAQILMIFSVRWVWAAMIFSVRYSAAIEGPVDKAGPAGGIWMICSAAVAVLEDPSPPKVRI